MSRKAEVSSRAAHSTYLWPLSLHGATAVTPLVIVVLRGGASVNGTSEWHTFQSIRIRSEYMHMSGILYYL